MKLERRISKSKIDLCRSTQFIGYSGVIQLGSYTVSDDVSTACTNGRDVIFGRAFSEIQSDKGLNYVNIHENMHKANRHTTVYKNLHKINPHVANLACDHYINITIEKADPTHEICERPISPVTGEPCGVLDWKYDGWSVSRIFNDLLERQNEGEGLGDDNGFDEHDWEGADAIPDKEKEELEQQIDRALRQGQMLQKKAGKGAGGLPRDLEELLYPKIDWRKALRDFVRSVCAGKDYSSWRKPNRRYLSTDTYMPSLVGESVGKIVLGVDTSGSMGEELNQAVSEAQAIINEVSPESVELLYWDYCVSGHETYIRGTGTALHQETEVKGGGGTDPNCVPQYMKDKGIKPELVIMFTDGYVPSWGIWDTPVMWCVINNKNAVASVGKTVHVEM